jgi:lipoyl(octanoyl) transferase
MEPKLSVLRVFFDTCPRLGSENMAVDELLLTSVQERPVIRFYTWRRPEVSFGYFDHYKRVRKSFTCPELHFVRRLTGGGVVDHRHDLTYTLVLPKHHTWSKLKGSESYRIIHEAVARALQQLGIDALLSQGEQGDGSIHCFEYPVCYDVVDKKGNKLAGAGQKRSNKGLLHQGSVQGVKNESCFWQCLLSELSDSHEAFVPDLSLLNKEKYEAEEWTQRR